MQNDSNANPLDLRLESVEILIKELQSTFDKFNDDLGFFSLKESGVSIEIKTKKGKYSYNLKQLKLLKAEMLDPVINSPKDIS